MFEKYWEKILIIFGTIVMFFVVILSKEEEDESALEDTEIVAILQKEIKSRNETILDAEKINRQDIIDAARSEIKIIETTLGKATDQGHLTALESKTDATAGTCFLTLVASTRSLTVAAAFADTKALLAMLGTRARNEGAIRLKGGYATNSRPAVRAAARAWRRDGSSARSLTTSLRAAHRPSGRSPPSSCGAAAGPRADRRRSPRAPRPGSTPIPSGTRG